jgi:hypothetical protein
MMGGLQSRAGKKYRNGLVVTEPPLEGKSANMDR